MPSVMEDQAAARAVFRVRADVEGLHRAAGGGGDVEGGGALSDEVRRRAVADEVAAPLTHAHWALHC